MDPYLKSSSPSNGPENILFSKRWWSDLWRRLAESGRDDGDISLAEWRERTDDLEFESYSYFLTYSPYSFLFAFLRISAWLVTKCLLKLIVSSNYYAHTGHIAFIIFTSSTNAYYLRSFNSRILTSISRLRTIYPRMNFCTRFAATWLLKPISLLSEKETSLKSLLLLSNPRSFYLKSVLGVVTSIIFLVELFLFDSVICISGAGEKKSWMSWSNFCSSIANSISYSFMSATTYRAKWPLNTFWIRRAACSLLTFAFTFFFILTFGTVYA